VKYQNKAEREIDRLPKQPLWYDCDMAVAGMIGFVLGIIFGLVM